MNYIFISPHFPVNFKHFVIRLKEQGVRVFGISNEPYTQLDPQLQSALSEYYKVDSMEDYTQMLKACGYFTHKYGKIDRIESHNEHWLDLDARLRTDFNVFGLKQRDLLKMQAKSKMKETFIQAGIPVARGLIVRTYEDAMTLIDEVGYPVVAKPDIGVGASHTFKICDEAQLTAFFNAKPKVDYIMEEFISGEIHTFDGLTDTSGRIVYINSFVFPVGVMETVNEDLDMYYYAQKTPPQDLRDYGEKIVRSFGIKERFFHIEFFRCKDGSLVVLEINNRPPGGYSMDLFNFTNSKDYYDEYAKIVAGKPVEVKTENLFYGVYVGQKAKNNNAYLYSRDDILKKFKDLIVFEGPIAGVFAAAIGNYGYILKGEDLDLLQDAAKTILAKKAG